MSTPVVAIVGRPNVGKSALFNRIARRQISLVFDKPGVTRDRISTQCKWNDYIFELIDTGGVGLEDESGFEEAIQREVEMALQVATDILLVVDARDGLNVLDKDIIRRLRKTNRRVWVLANKVDASGNTDLEVEFAALRIDKLWPVSAAHGYGIGELFDELTKHWEAMAQEEKADEPRSIRIGILGRPNVGKSSLVNALLQEERVIVSPIAGTTRDAVDIEFQHANLSYTLIDTAGMRKKSRIADPLEQAMTGRSAHVVNRADICLLVIDAVEGVNEQEQKIAGLIHKAHRPCVVVINKWDLIVKAQRENPEESIEVVEKKYREAVLQKLFFVNYAEVVFISALKEKRLSHLLKALEQLGEQLKVRVNTGVLNRVLKKAMERQLPPRIGGRAFKILYATQMDEPIPTIKAFVNEPKLLTDSYRRYLEQQIRAEYPYKGCPMVWHFTGRKEA